MGSRVLGFARVMGVLPHEIAPKMGIGHTWRGRVDGMTDAESHGVKEAHCRGLIGQGQPKGVTCFFVDFHDCADTAPARGRRVAFPPSDMLRTVVGLPIQ